MHMNMYFYVKKCTPENLIKIEKYEQPLRKSGLSRYNYSYGGSRLRKDGRSQLKKKKIMAEAIIKYIQICRFEPDGPTRRHPSGELATTRAWTRVDI
jgi:hypothetical protein